MPIYEFYSPDTHKLYQFLARSLSLRDVTPLCPDGSSLRMERRVSQFAIIGKAKEQSDEDPFAGMDDAKVDAMMADMENEMAGIDDDHPNPKHLGRLMRRMTDLMGDRTPTALKELVGRLEAGEDPEKLEEKFGPMDGEDGSDGMGGGTTNAELWEVVKAIRGLRQQTKRDPRLYEMRDFLPATL
jgi:hypothetical protein